MLAGSTNVVRNIPDGTAVLIDPNLATEAGADIVAVVFIPVGTPVWTGTVLMLFVLDGIDKIEESFSRRDEPNVEDMDIAADKEGELVAFPRGVVAGTTAVGMVEKAMVVIISLSTAAPETAA